MQKPGLRDRNCRLYVVCTFVSVLAILAVTIISFAYLILAAPSEAHTLNEGEYPVGFLEPIIGAVIYLVCLALLIKDMRRRMRGCPPEEKDARFMRAPLSKAAILLSITATTSVAIILLSHLIHEGITEDFLDGYSTYAIMAMMLNAGPQEEIIFRLLLIGVPMSLICGLKGRGGSKELLGGFGMSRIALVLLAVSSVLFGLMHLDGWSIMKFPDTFISGMLFGYVYIQYGLHATIVMHSAFDLLASFDLIFDGLGTVPLVFLSVLGAVLLIRSLLNIRGYIPGNTLHEPFEGSLLDMWERERSGGLSEQIKRAHTFREPWT